MFFFLCIVISYLLVPFFFSVGYSIAFMITMQDQQEKVNKIFTHFGVVTLCGALALYLFHRSI
jgi:putative lipase involved disintegration of autophagic bodies